MTAVWWRCRPIAAAVAAVALAGAGTAVTVVATPRAALAASDSSAATDDRYQALVRRLWLNDPRWEVRSAARSALISDLPNAIPSFLAPGGGYQSARDRAAENAGRNDLIISRAIATSTPTRSPHVHMTAKRAQHGTLDEKDRYVRAGLADAQKLDAKNAPIVQAEKQAELDRKYVTALAGNASGAWVKAAAQRAIQLGTDSGIADFFTYSWQSAADCDLQQFRMEYAEQDTISRHKLQLLLVAAQAAQQAYEQASDAARQKAAEDARSAWNAAAEVAASTKATWLANQSLATSQAGSWQVVRDFAAQATTEQNWSSIATRAAATNTSWADELAWAQDQASVWAGLEASTRVSAAAIPTVVPAASAPGN